MVIKQVWYWHENRHTHFCSSGTKVRAEKYSPVHTVTSCTTKEAREDCHWTSPSPCAQPTARANNTQTLELGTEKGLLQGHARRWVAHALQTPMLLKAFIKALLKALVEGGRCLAVTNFLSEPLFLRSGHGQMRCSYKSLPNKCYSLSRYERAMSQGATFILQGPGPG